MTTSQILTELRRIMETHPVTAVPRERFWRGELGDLEAAAFEDLVAVRKKIDDLPGFVRSLPEFGEVSSVYNSMIRTLTGQKYELEELAPGERPYI